MAPPKRPWFRVYTEMMQDRKLRRLPPAQRWVWMAVLSLSCQSPERGRLLLAEGEPATLDDVADEAALPKAQTSKAMLSFERLGMVATDENDVWTVPKWDDRQHESDNSTERVQRHRSARRNDDETLHHRSSNAEETTAETLPPHAGATEAEAEAEAEADQERGESRGKPRSDRATRIPDGWTPDLEPQLQAEAEQARVDLHRELERFRDHWHAQPGAKGRKVSWQATWRNWLRRAIDDRPKTNGTARPPPRSQQVSDHGDASQTGSFTP